MVNCGGGLDRALTILISTLRALKSKSQLLVTSTPELDNNFDMTSNYSRGNDVNPRDILLLIKSTIPDTETRGLLKVRYLRVRSSGCTHALILY